MKQKIASTQNTDELESILSLFILDKCSADMKVKLASTSSTNTRVYEATVKADVRSFTFDRILFDAYARKYQLLP